MVVWRATPSEEDIPVTNPICERCIKSVAPYCDSSPGRKIALLRSSLMALLVLILSITSDVTSWTEQRVCAILSLENLDKYCRLQINLRWAYIAIVLGFGIVFVKVTRSCGHFCCWTSCGFCQPRCNRAIQAQTALAFSLSFWVIALILTPFWTWPGFAILSGVFAAASFLLQGHFITLVPAGNKGSPGQTYGAQPVVTLVPIQQEVELWLAKAHGSEIPMASVVLRPADSSCADAPFALAASACAYPFHQVGSPSQSNTMFPLDSEDRL